MDELQKKRCSDCIKWDYTSQNSGFCRANAPYPQVVPASAGDLALCWPSTGTDDWCMSFEPQPKKETVQ